jgi:hypothetical protein
MLQILGVAVAVDCDNIRVDCSEVQRKRKLASEKTAEELKEQSEFRNSVGGALVTFATNESMSAYAVGNRELRQAEVEIENLEDEIEEAEEECNAKKVARLKKRLARWQKRNNVLENMLFEHGTKGTKETKKTPEEEALAQAEEEEQENSESD